MYLNRPKTDGTTGPYGLTLTWDVFKFVIS